MSRENFESTIGARTIGSLLQQPYSHLQRNSYRELEALGHAGIRRAHSAVFRNLKAEGSRISEMAAEAGMTKQSMGYLVESLRKEGFLLLETDPGDARAKRVQLTSKGEGVVESLRQLSAGLERKLCDEFGMEWVSELREKLIQLEGFVKNIEAREEPR